MEYLSRTYPTKITVHNRRLTVLPCVQLASSRVVPTGTVPPRTNMRRYGPVATTKLLATAIFPYSAQFY